METESEIPKGDLVKALAKAKKAFKPIVKNKEVKAGAYSYKYAELSHILDAITPALNDNDLVITQDVMGDVMVTRLMHSSGQVIKSSMPIVAGGKPGPQGYASSVTYARRYSVCNLICISADDDLDAQDVQDSHDATKKQKTPQFDTVRTQNKAVPAAGSTHPSEAQLTRLFAIAKKSNWSTVDVKDYISQLGIESTKDLNYSQYESLCDKMQKFPKAKAVDKHVQ